jgi:hypothetical protein
MILWEVSFEYVHFNEQADIKDRKVYGNSPYKVHWVSELIEKALPHLNGLRLDKMKCAKWVPLCLVFRKLSEGAITVNYKWVYKIKYGSRENFKIRFMTSN